MWTLGQRLSPLDPDLDPVPNWARSTARWIESALRDSQLLPSGGWYVVGPSAAIPTGPTCARIAGRSLVVWRTSGALHAAPNVCPHMGGPLAEGAVRGERLVCPWHGLGLSARGNGAWAPLPTHDDGVLFWVRLDADGEPTTAQPQIDPRPRGAIDVVVTLDARCDPVDVIKNRLDPWHGDTFHPSSFSRLRVLAQRPAEIDIRVAYRLAGPASVEVDARFTCPNPRTIVMTILEGEGAGSVVETHATPMGPGRTRITEAAFVTSSRTGFRLASAFPRVLGSVVRPLVSRRLRRLWEEDATYAERLYLLRTGGA